MPSDAQLVQSDRASDRHPIQKCQTMLILATTKSNSWLIQWFSTMMIQWLVDIEPNKTQPGELIHVPQRLGLPRPWKPAWEPPEASANAEAAQHASTGVGGSAGERCGCCQLVIVVAICGNG